MRIVIDTNVLVSAALFEKSVPRKALTHTMALHTPLISRELVREYERIMVSSKFDTNVPRNKRTTFLIRYVKGADTVEISGALQVCRDPRDNMVIETAIEGSADVLITGDMDIISLRPLSGVEIVTPSEFVAKYT